MMMQQFPIFVDLHAAPPLIIGDAPILAAKLRLLQKAAPLIEVMARPDANWLSEFSADHRVKWLGPDVLGAAKAAIKGRPLVILDCADPAKTAALARAARAYGVPVNVPDNTQLSSFYLAAIVDRAPLIIAISTSGLAPVLGQAIRAKLENMLVPHYGQLAPFLAGLRRRLKQFTPARRRQILHDVIDGPAAKNLLSGNRVAADHHVDALIASKPHRQSALPARALAPITLVACGNGDGSMLPLAALNAIRGADHIIYDPAAPAPILEMARREVELTQMPDRQTIDAPWFSGSIGDLAACLRQAAEAGQALVWLLAGRAATLTIQNDPSQHPVVQMLSISGFAVSSIPAALASPESDLARLHQIAGIEGIIAPLPDVNRGQGAWQ